jgi:hydrogenase maturation protein HypF
VSADQPRIRERIAVTGTVQGVGFRPFVWREATARGLAGYVVNTPGGVTLEAEGTAESVEALVGALRQPPPPAATVTLAREMLAPIGETGFSIRDSALGGTRSAAVLPDLATCDACLAEVLDPRNRRYRYPFTNCTHCGPRYSIITDLPYDRARTTMRRFIMCPDCQVEYESPADRRFHAEPNACPVCGPQLALWDGQGRVLATRDDALKAAAAALAEGRIVAVKGLGGFHLMADARNEAAVQALRQRKHREEKPFAVMFASLAALSEAADPTDIEIEVLTSRERPIVLVRRRPNALAESVAPGNPLVGAMLPYTPLHHLLLAEIGFPVVATSGNRSDEPICTDEHEALARLAGIADLFLVHDRPVERPVDDSVVRVIADQPTVFRRARGMAPSVAARGVPAGILAVGGHMKTTVALSTEAGAVLSQHLGDLDTAEAYAAYSRAVTDIQRLHDARPRIVARDLHPDYRSTEVAEALEAPKIAVQHHLAHVAACMAEHGLEPPVLGVSWDGTGYGTDGTIWGGEFLRVTADGWERVAHLKPFRLPGGEAAVREPRRSAIGLLHAAFGAAALGMTDLAPVAAFTNAERRTLASMLDRGLNAPVTTSAGRLFDAVAALLDLRQKVSHEGQAAMMLEWLADSSTAQNLGAGETSTARRNTSPTKHGLARVWHQEWPKSEESDFGAGEVARRSRAGEGYGHGSARPPLPVPLPLGERGRIRQGPPYGNVSPELAGIRRYDDGEQSYPFGISEPNDAPLILDWQPMLEALIADIRSGVAPAWCAARFHDALALAIAEMAGRIGEKIVVLSGGCFQNARLTEKTLIALNAAGLLPVRHERVPPNDGGLALGQLWWAGRQTGAV